MKEDGARMKRQALYSNAQFPGCVCGVLTQAYVHQHDCHPPECERANKMPTRTSIATVCAIGPRRNLLEVCGKTTAPDLRGGQIVVAREVRTTLTRVVGMIWTFRVP